MAEDFLYHLYRGSEFLADGRYDGARAELDLALKLQPRDAGAQDLLAKLYFRLGVYPRAIELYHELIRQFPDRVAPRINLALAYLKTGQARDVVEQLLPVIDRDPGHTRAWGYLGLAWSRLGEYAKAREAFLRAGHEGMARRMDEALEAQIAAALASPPRGSLAPLPRTTLAPPALPPAPPLPRDGEAFAGGGGGEDRAELLGRLVAGALEEIDSGALEPTTRATGFDAAAVGRWTAPAPADESAASSARRARPAGLLDALGEDDAVLAPAGASLRLEAGGALLVSAGCAARLDAGVLGVGLARGEVVARRGGGAAGPFAGEPRLVWLRAGWAALAPRRAAFRVVVTLRDEALAVCEPSLLAFDGALGYDNGHVGGGEPLAVVTLRGTGRVALEAPGVVRAVVVRPDAPVTLPRDWLVAWSGALSLAPLAGGDGAAAPCVQIMGEGIIAARLGTESARESGLNHG